MQAEVSTSFINASGGVWAGMQLHQALQSGREISPADLRMLDTLREDQWKFFDKVALEEAQLRLRAVKDLYDRGLTLPVANAMGTAFYQYEKMSDMQPATVSMGGMAQDRTENDRVDFTPATLPLAITHKGFSINLRTLAASRRDPAVNLDDTQARLAARLVAETLESMLINGSKKFGGSTIYGYTNYPYRKQVTFENAKAWDNAAKDGAGILTDVKAMLAAATSTTNRHFGPFVLYIPNNYTLEIEDDFKAASDKTIRQRILDLEGIESIRTLDSLADGNVLLVQMTKDVVAMIDGETTQTVQWDIEGGFEIRFKIFAIQVPLLRSDYSNRCGIVHLAASH